MLLSSALRECCAKHYVHRAFCNAQKCVKSLNVSGLASSTSQLFVRRNPQHFVKQTRGVKTHKHRQQEEWKQKNKTILTYIAAAGVGMIGMSYAAVPLYRLYCQVSPECSMALILQICRPFRLTSKNSDTDFMIMRVV